MKKILFLTRKDTKNPKAWWAERIMYLYARWLVDKWYDVTWFAYHFGWAKSQEIIDWIKIIRKFNILSSFFLFPFYYKRHFEWKFDVIIDEAWWLPFLTPLFTKDKKFLFVHHIWDKEFDLAMPMPISRIAKKIYLTMFKFYKNTNTIVVSDSTKQDMIKLWNNPKNIHIIQNTTNIKAIKKIPNKKNKILCFGRIMPVKRVEEIIYSFEIFLRQNPDYTLSIIWKIQDKKYFKKIKKIIIDNRLEKNIDIVGFIPDGEFEAVLSEHKAMMVTSCKEWYWLVVIEANAFGIPVIWYDVWWIKDSIQNGKNGYIVPDGDRKAMSDKTSEILSDPIFYHKLCESCISHISQIPSEEQNIKKFIQILDL